MASILDTFAVYCHTRLPVYWLMAVCTGIASMPKLRAANHGQNLSGTTAIHFPNSITKKYSSGDRNEAWFKILLFSILVKCLGAPVYQHSCQQQYTDCKLFVPVCGILVTSRLLEDATTASESWYAYFVIVCGTICINIVFHSSKQCPFLTFSEYSQHKAVYYKYSSMQARTAVYDMGLAEMVGQVFSILAQDMSSAAFSLNSRTLNCPAVLTHKSIAQQACSWLSRLSHTWSWRYAYHSSKLAQKVPSVPE